MRYDVGKLFFELSPCDDCLHKYRCEEQLMACRVFSGYVVRGTFNPDAPRIPSYLMYENIFVKDDLKGNVHVES